MHLIRLEKSTDRPNDIEHLVQASDTRLPNSFRSVQLLRFIAAASVVVFHSAVAVEKFYPRSIDSTLADVLGLGAAGVHIFFVISGFVMVFTSFRGSRPFTSSSFLFRRAARIYPIYVLYCVAYLLFYNLVRGNDPIAPLEAIYSFLLVPGHASNIIGPAWTLAYEVYFYLCFGLFMRFGLLRGLVSLTCFFLVSMASRLLLGTNDPIVQVFTNQLLLEFLAGCWLGYLVLARPRLPARAGALCILVGVIGFAIGLLLGYNKTSSIVVWGLPSAFLVAGFVFHELTGRFSRTFMSKIAFLGDSSYSLYLLHVLLIDIFLIYCGPFLGSQGARIGHPLWVVGATTTIAICCSIIMYQTVEMHILKLAQGASPFVRAKSRAGQASVTRGIRD